MNARVVNPWYDRGVWRAVCDCGWSHPEVRHDRARAEQLAAEHIAGHSRPWVPWQADALEIEPDDGAPNGELAAIHVNYPHEPGYLFDCPGCEQGPCVCERDDGLAPCVSNECVRGDE